MKINTIAAWSLAALVGTTSLVGSMSLSLAQTGSPQVPTPANPAPANPTATNGAPTEAPAKAGNKMDTGDKMSGGDKMMMKKKKTKKRMHHVRRGRMPGHKTF